MKAWNIRRWKFYSIINKLAAKGRIIIEEVPDSHERRFYPVFLRRQRASPPPQKQAEIPQEHATLDDPAVLPAETSVDTPQTPESQNPVVLTPGAELIAARGIDAKTAVELAEGASMREITSALKAFDDYARRHELRVPARALINAVRKRWKPVHERSPVTDDRAKKTVPNAPDPVDPKAVESAAAKIPALARLLQKHGGKAEECRTSSDENEKTV